MKKNEEIKELKAQIENKEEVEAYIVKKVEAFDK